MKQLEPTRDMPRMGPKHKLNALPLLLPVLLTWTLTGCDNFKHSLRQADQDLQALFGTNESPAAERQPPSQTALLIPPEPAMAPDPEPEPAAAKEAPGTPAYRQGLAARRAGDDGAAADLFESAADDGHAAAAYELGLAYENGKGRPIDHEAANKWVGIAAERGDARALYLIGVTYALGEGVEQNDEVATAYFRDAARQGHSYAQFLLAEAYANGRGVPRDPAWAMVWYGKAARQGHREAQFAYGALLGTGTGLPKDEGKAYGWFLLAERAGHPQAPKLRAALGKRLSPDQKTRGENLADSFRGRTSADFADPPTVMYVQYSLNGLGYDAGPVDGFFGPKSRAAFAAFERDHGLAPEGNLTPASVERLVTVRRAAADDA